MATPGSPTDASSINNLRDILQTYNKLTELCFNKCVSNMNYRELTEREASCVNRCSGKYISGNQRIMGSFMEIQSRKQQQLMEEAAKMETEQNQQMSASDQAALGFDIMKQHSQEGNAAPQLETDQSQATSGAS